MSADPAMIIHPFHPPSFAQLPCMVIMILSEEGEVLVSGFPDGVSKKTRPFGGGLLRVWLP